MKRRMRCEDDYALAAEDALKQAVKYNAMFVRVLISALDRDGPELLSRVAARNEIPVAELERITNLYREVGERRYKAIVKAEMLEGRFLL